ncbi:MAG: LysR family transcriptional regulator [Kiloniellales bacterium]|nr:LysR family transcriptional regulator [Kiloniellales bacterium]
MPLTSNDLGTVLAVARGGSLSAAARALGVNHSTVSRRLAALEAATGQTLFRRLSRGYAPTPAGETLIEAAERLEAELQGLERLLSGRDIRLRGTLRLTAPDDVANHLLLPLLASFRRAFPGILLELVIDNRTLNLGRREADVALRATNRPQASLVGRRVAGLAATVYAAQRLVDKAGQPEDLPWVAWEDDGQSNNLKSWIEAKAPPERIAYRANSVANQFAALRAGMGQGVLPCYLGDPAPDLVRILAPQPELEAGLWILTHPDLRQAARVAALTEFLFTELKRREPLLNGRAP